MENSKEQLFKGFSQHEHAENFIAGKLLFRSMSYFMRAEDGVRGDVNEGRHVEAPRHPVQIEVLSTGKKISSEFEFHNIAGRPDKVFIHSFTTSKSVAQKFGAFVVKIGNPSELATRTRRSLARLNVTTKLDEPYLKAGLVSYYDPESVAPSSINIKDANSLVFLKQQHYEVEEEYRLAFSRKGSLGLVQKLTTKAYSPLEDLKSAVDGSVFLDIGSLADISSIV